MTLVEPARSLTDFALGILALIAAVWLSARETGNPHWRWFFAWIGIVALWGGFHHGFIVGHETAAKISWSAISLMVAIAISYLLAASVNSVLGKGRGRPLLIVRAVSLAVFFSLVVSGNASITTLLLTEGLTMAIVLALWVHAWQKEQPGVSLVLAAIIFSMLAAAAKASGAQFTMGGWEFDPNAIYHVAQMPGMLLLLIAVRRRADAMEKQPLWKSGGVTARA